jgi:acyl-lipid omega-6 desaturase (Delta-12 desaturase)
VPSLPTATPAAPTRGETVPAAAPAEPSPALDPRGLSARLAPFKQADPRRGARELLVTAVPFALLWLLAWWGLGVGYWLSLLVAVPTAGLLVRLFMIQHDCGHGAFFPRRAANDWVGRSLGVLTLTPYDFWRRSHAIHHATSGNLDRRGIGDLATLTVGEYRSLPRWRRAGYRVYRHPLFLFGLAPAFLFLLQHRLPVGQLRGGLEPWLSAMLTNLGVAVLFAAMMAAVGVGPFLLVHLPVVLLAASAGVWLFYVQHQFEDTYWEGDGGWTMHEGALHGSSHYDLPAVLRWFTANIGLHHVHHLSSRIPSYRLPEVVRAHPELAHVNRITLLQSLRTVRLALWDEGQRRLVSFREAAALP